MRTNPFSPIYALLNSGNTEIVSTKMPVLIDIELTNICNFECLFCHTGTKSHKRSRGYMTKEMYLKIIDEIAPYKIPLRFIRWGEPTIHKDFIEFIQLAKQKEIMCHFNTNGSMLNHDVIEKLLEIQVDSIKFSFQGTDEKTYAEMRLGKSFDKLVRTVKLFSEMRGNLQYPYLHAATTITSETPEMVKKFEEELGMYCDLVTVGHTKLEHIATESINLQGKSKELLAKHKENESIVKKYSTCKEVYNKLSINWDGTVSACCGDYDNYMIVGDLKENSIQEIWEKSVKLRTYREMLSAGKQAELPLCKYCYDVYQN